DAYDPNLVQVHVSGLRRKLEAHGPRILHTVRGDDERADPAAVELGGEQVGGGVRGA
ncbi:helix-turn-helix domain-containing protein, partial [Mycobacterium avium]|uniref:helix-turn-helix domain-containing protein n=1 Tax=Mycobacterium avium TaxID=1764 RepID=UPI001E3A7B27